MKAFLALAVTAATFASSAATRLQAAPDACALLKAAEVGAALGVRSVRATPRGAAECTYRGAGKPDVLTIEVHHDDAAGWTGIAAGNMMIGAGKTAPKIGDESRYGAMGQVLYVRKGTSWIGVDMRGVMKDPATIGPGLARKAIARL